MIDKMVAADRDPGDAAFERCTRIMLNIGSYLDKATPVRVRCDTKPDNPKKIARLHDDPHVALFHALPEVYRMALPPEQLLEGIGKAKAA